MKGNLGKNVTALFVPGYGRIPALEVEFVPSNPSRTTGVSDVTAMTYLSANVSHYLVPSPTSSSTVVVPVVAAYLLYESGLDAEALNQEWEAGDYLRKPQQFATR